LWTGRTAPDRKPQAARVVLPPQRPYPGRKRPRDWTTTVHSEVHGLQILDGRITVEDVVARLTSECGRSELVARVFPTGHCAIQGLMLDHRPVEVTLDIAPFVSARPMPPFWLGRARTLSSAAGSSAGPGLWRLAESPLPHRLQRDVPGRAPEGVEYCPPNRIRWHGVGTIYLGELLVSDLFRRLTMLRVALARQLRATFPAERSRTTATLCRELSRSSPGGRPGSGGLHGPARGRHRSGMPRRGGRVLQGQASRGQKRIESLRATLEWFAGRTRSLAPAPAQSRSVSRARHDQRRFLWWKPPSSSGLAPPLELRRQVILAGSGPGAKNRTPRFVGPRGGGGAAIGGPAH